MLDAALNVLRTRKSFAVLGVSRDPSKYGHEVFEVLRKDYAVYPINPKYDAVDGHRCYAFHSLFRRGNAGIGRGVHRHARTGAVRLWTMHARPTSRTRRA